MRLVACLAWLGLARPVTHNDAGKVAAFEAADGKLERLFDKLVDALRQQLVNFDRATEELRVG